MQTCHALAGSWHLKGPCCFAKLENASCPRLVSGPPNYLLRQITSNLNWLLVLPVVMPKHSRPRGAGFAMPGAASTGFGSTCKTPQKAPRRHITPIT
jgi:hypothetical protein